MNKQLFSRGVFYTLGLLLIALGITFHSRHNFGNGPFTQFNYILSNIFNRQLGTMIMIVSSIIITIYFIKKRNKDIILSIIATLIFGNMINLFDDVVFYDLYIASDAYLLRVLMFILAVNVISIGIVFMVKTDLSMLDLELATVLLSETKLLKKFNFGQIRMIMDAFSILMAIILSLIFLNNFDITMYLATFMLFFVGGPMLNVYLKIYDKIFKNSNETLNKEEIS